MPVRLKNVSLGLTIILALLAGAAAATQPTRPPVPKQFEVFAPYWTLEPGWHTELLIRNNMATQSVTVTPALRTSAGVEVKLPSLALKPDEVQSVDLMSAITAAAPQLAGAANSYGSLVFRYTSPSLANVYASIMVHRDGLPIGYHFDAAAAIPEFSSGSYEGIWWLPHDTTSSQLVLSNISTKPIKATLTLSDSKGKTASSVQPLAPGQTSRVDVRDAVSRGYLDGAYGGVSVIFDSGAGNAQVVLFDYDETAGFSTLMKIQPRGADMTQGHQTLRAPTVALSNPDPILGLPEGTSLQSQVFVRNASTSPVALNAAVSWRGDSGAWGVVNLPVVQFAPLSSQVVDLTEFQNSGTIPSQAHWATVTLSYVGAEGDVVPVQASYADNGRYLLQSPFQDVLSFMWKGGQWSISATQDALLTTGNAGTKPTRVGVILYYNGGAGKYEFAPQTLQPEQAITIDVGKIIASQVPDMNGHTIPPETTMGSYELNDLDDPNVGYLYEGKLQVDRRNGFVTYGCATCCAYFGPYITGFTTNVGDSGPVALFASNDCTEQQEDFTSIAWDWASSNNSIATLTGPWVSAVAPGSTYSNAHVNIRTEASSKCPFQTVFPLGFITVRPPPQFNVAYSDYIPVDHVDGPTSCTYQQSSFTKIYMGDGNRGTYRTTESIFITPDLQSSWGFFQDTGQTRNYGAGSPANGSILSAADEDNVALDCLLWNNVGKATPAFSHSESYPSANHGQVHFWGSAANPLEDQSATINWDMTVLLDDSNPSFPTAVTTYTHTCYPAHQVKVNGSVAYSYTPPQNDTGYIFDCLWLHVNMKSGSYGPVYVPNH